MTKHTANEFMSCNVRDCTDCVDYLKGGSMSKCIEIGCDNESALGGICPSCVTAAVNSITSARNAHNMVGYAAHQPSQLDRIEESLKLMRGVADKLLVLADAHEVATLGLIEQKLNRLLGEPEQLSTDTAASYTLTEPRGFGIHSPEYDKGA